MSRNNATPPITPVRRHNPWYIRGGNVVVQVDDVLFRIHDIFLLRESAYFRSKLSYPRPPGDIAEGSSDNNPLVIYDADAEAFARLVWVFYNPHYSVYTATLEEWTSILTLANQWGFGEVRALAIRELEKMDIDAISKIHLYQSFKIESTYLKGAITELATREKPISLEEGNKLGMNTSLQIACLREASRRVKPALPSPVTVTEDDMGKLIRKLFKFPPEAQSGLSTAGAGPNLDTLSSPSDPVPAYEGHNTKDTNAAMSKSR
ncbi:hypothetical protein BV25DRAFT_1834697 [Artomyces pyxidatus]|uniref:Uncharacterized protein n=1 Tax=Artomyces pyxidatus TaxID=48021 RepID=A0ACB8TGR5_9AGAM|nr:hypothetical protein BV25DRAFT_1834697 [Artomyces pyxidatus]